MSQSNEIQQSRHADIAPIIHEVSYAERIANGIKRTVLEQANLTQGRIVVSMELALTPEYVSQNMIKLQQNGFSPASAYYLANVVGMRGRNVNIDEFTPNSFDSQYLVNEERANRTSDDDRFLDTILTTLDELQKEPIINGRLLFITESTNNAVEQSQEMTLISEMMDRTVSYAVNENNLRTAKSVFYNVLNHRVNLRQERNKQLSEVTLSAMDLVNADKSLIIVGADHEVGMVDGLQVVTLDRQQRRNAYPTITTKTINLFGEEIKSSYTAQAELLIQQGQQPADVLLAQSFIDILLLKYCGQHLLRGRTYDYNSMYNGVTELIGRIKDPQAFLTHLESSHSLVVTCRQFLSPRLSINKFDLSKFVDGFAN